VIFQDFSGTGIFKKKSRTFQEAWDPWREEHFNTLIIDGE